MDYAPYLNIQKGASNKMMTKKQKLENHRKTKGYLEKKDKRNHKFEIKKLMEQARERVIERDEHECQICEVLGIFKKLYGHNCQIHHIIPKTFCKGEYEPLLYDDKNLLLLCWRHHHADPRISPHMNAIAFVEFLKEYKLELFDYALSYTNIPINHIKSLIPIQKK